MKKFILSLFVVFAMVLAVGCNHTPPVEYPYEVTPPEANDYDEPDTTEPIISPGRRPWFVELATEEFLRDYNTPVEFIEFDEEGYQRIAILPIIEMRDFRWMEIGIDTVNDNFVFYEANVLYSAGDLQPHTPFVVTWMEWGTMPHRGISFVDAHGERRYFTLGMNHAEGEEGAGSGMFMLNEFGRE